MAENGPALQQGHKSRCLFFHVFYWKLIDEMSAGFLPLSFPCRPLFSTGHTSLSCPITPPFSSSRRLSWPLPQSLLIWIKVRISYSS